MMATSCHSANYFKKDIPELCGKTERQLLHKFGKPVEVRTNSVEQFAQAPEPWQPSTQAVLSIYPTNIPANLFVEIRSLSWQKGRIMITAWVHLQGQQWIALYVEKWNMDTIE